MTNPAVHSKFWEQIMQQVATTAPTVTNSEDEFQFSMRQVGVADEFEVVPHFHGSNPTNAHIPTFTNLEPIQRNEAEIRKDFEQKYMKPQLFDPKNTLNDQKIWPRSLNSNDLYHLELPKFKWDIVPVRDNFSGRLLGVKEVKLKEEAATVTESSSLQRQPGQTKDFVRGSAQHVPFLPGGVKEDEKVFKALENPFKKPSAENVEDEINIDELIALGKTELAILEDESLMEQVPPGLERGLFQSKSANPKAKEQAKTDVIELGKNASDLLAPFKVDVREYERNVAGGHYADDGDANVSIHKQREQYNKSKNIVRLDDVFRDQGTDPLNDIIAEAKKQEETQLSPTAASKVETEIKEEAGEQEESRKKEYNSVDDFLDEEQDDVLKMRFKQQYQSKSSEWAVVDNTDVSNFHELVPAMAIDYPFDLDIFQKRAIYHLENNQSVFVSAHTSAGKTVVAEYAIALAQKHLTRVIYTSPIKTLSNQKFREFKKTFGDVGILTGDVQINPTATCLIMTTEILRSMLYKGADLIRDVEWVIFDEVHYINDIDRGVVWEEVIIMLPSHINLILLSATVPNTFEFADWIGRTKKKQVFVISTLKRPVPLEHHLYYNSDLYKIVDFKGTFLNAGYRSALEAQKEKDRYGKKNFKSGVSKAKTEQNDWVLLIEILRKKKLIPVVVFSFSRKRCEDLAYGLSNVDLNESREASEAHAFIEQSFNRLRPEDRKLPQILSIKDLLKRGIGVHHSGLLPIVKEVVEILFARGIVKILFATETFAMGVNFPTRTVVFNSLRKHDGRQFRELLPSEYIQMSGRAGRRGLDTTGMVIINCGEDIPEEAVLQTMILGRPTKLESQFKLSYNMILNLLRIEDFKVEDMIKRSFSEAHNQKYLPNYETLAKTQEMLQNDVETLDCLFGEPAIDYYYSLARELEQCNETVQQYLFTSPITVSLLSAGRVCVIQSTKYGPTLAVILKLVASAPKADVTITNQSSNDAKSTYLFLELKLSVQVTNKIPYPSETGLPTYSPILFGTDMHSASFDFEVLAASKILGICKSKLNVSLLRIPANTTSLRVEDVDSSSVMAIVQQLQQLWESNPVQGPEIHDPISDLKLNQLEVAETNAKRKTIITKMLECKCCKCPKLPEQYAHTDKRERIKEKINTLKFALSDSNLELMPQVQNRLQVLKVLKYISADASTVQLKGRVACEINTCDELIATEMVFENFFTNLEPEEVVAMLSCLICQSKSEIEPVITERLAEAKNSLLQLTLTLGQLQMECGLDTSPQDYKDTLNFGLMQVAYEWALQKPFAEICKATDILEGNIVRSLTQIDQACRELRNAARVIGDNFLYQKMEKASQLIKRDIVFATSLYIQ